MNDRGRRRRRSTTPLPGTGWSTRTRPDARSRKSSRWPARSSTPAGTRRRHLDPKVVTPHLRPARHRGGPPRDPAATGDPRRRGHDNRARRRGSRAVSAGRATACGTTGAGQARAQRERPPLAAPVLEVERAEIAVDPHDRTAPPGGDLFDHKSGVRRDVARAAASGCSPVSGEYIGSVAVERHGSTLARRQARGRLDAPSGGEAAADPATTPASRRCA
jgi:hypothetical protein